MARILLVDDEQSMLNVLTSVLEHENYEVVAVLDGESALEHLRAEEFDLMISDIRMVPMNGMVLLKHAHEMKPEMAILMITAYSSIETAIEAQKLGAFDYILKPFKVDELLLSIQQALKFANIASEESHPGQHVAEDYYFGEIIAKSPAMQHACDRVKQVAPVDTPILINGPKGTGKQLLAKTIHENSRRKDSPFAPFHCGRVQEDVIEKSLFGEGSTAGLLEEANGGTVFIAEISKLPATAQERLLIAMKEKSLTRVDSTTSTAIDVRIVAASRVPLESLTTSDGSGFREDLFYSLSSISIEIPALTDCVEDILPIAYAIVFKATPEGLPAPVIDTKAEQCLISYSWPGNAEELKKVITDVISTLHENVITKESLPPEIASVSTTQENKEKHDEVTGLGRNLKSFIKSKEQSLLQEIVDQSGGDKMKAAQALNISLAELNRKLSDE